MGFRGVIHSFIASSNGNNARLFNRNRYVSFANDVAWLGIRRNRLLQPKFGDAVLARVSTRTRLVNPSVFRCFSSSSGTPREEHKKENVDKEELESDNGEKQRVSSRNDGQGETFRLFRRLVELAEPEKPLIGASLASLVVTSSISLVFPAAIGKILDISLQDGSGISPMYVASGLLGLFVVQGAFIVGRSAMLSIAGERFVARFRKQLFNSILAQNMEFFDSRRTGVLINRLSTDTQMVQKSLTVNLASGIRNVFMAIGGSAMLIYTSPSLALVSLSVIPPVGLLARRFGRSVKRRQMEVQDALAETSSIAEEVISNIRTVRQFSGEKMESKKYEVFIDAAYRKAALIGLSAAWFDGCVHFAANMSLVAVLGYGGSLVMAQELTAGSLTSFLMYSVYTGFNITSLSSVYSDLMRSLGATSRVLEIIDRVPTMPSPLNLSTTSTSNGSCSMNALPKAWLQKARSTVERSESHYVPLSSSFFDLSTPCVGNNLQFNQPRGTQVLASSGYQQLDSESIRLKTPIIQGKIEFDDVSFSYPARPQAQVLNRFNLSVDRGQSLAIVGQSGSGKSTIVSLLTRLYQPQNGTIKIDGVDISEIEPDYYRHNIGVVSQEPTLFSSSIEENIRYGAPYASVEEVEFAAKQANAHSFIEAFPDGYLTMLGERGVTLSGGQKQRVAIARALLVKPKVILLDEATSALDTASEALVQNALERIMKNSSNSCVVIAHRLSTVRKCNKIAVLDTGRVIQYGTHDDLMKDSSGMYASLVSKQLR